MTQTAKSLYSNKNYVGMVNKILPFIQFLDFIVG